MGVLCGASDATEGCQDFDANGFWIAAFVEGVICGRAKGGVENSERKTQDGIGSAGCLSRSAPRCIAIEKRLMAAGRVLSWNGRIM